MVISEVYHSVTLYYFHIRCVKINLCLSLYNRKPRCLSTFLQQADDGVNIIKDKVVHRNRQSGNGVHIMRDVITYIG